MHILCLGLNHQTAGVCLRERLAYGPESTRAALARLQCGDMQVDSVSEVVILSTCNRVEIYAAAQSLEFGPLERFLGETRNVGRDEFEPHLYRLADHAAVEHLFRVAAGLDSMVLGEAQILGQVTQAFELGRGQNTAGPVLNRLFQAAIHTGKRARTETPIGYNAASVSSMAVRLAAETVRPVEAARVAILGAGDMAELTVEALRKRGVQRIWVVNRTLARAQELAQRWSGEAATFEMLPEVLEKADIVISSTSAPHTLIHPEMVEAARTMRQGRPLAIIDIAVPRDVDPRVGEMRGVALYDLDGLQQHLQNSLAERQRQVPQVEQIVRAEQEAFGEYLRSLELLPLIAAITQQAESVRQSELDKTLRRLPELNEAERQRIEALTVALVKKLLHAPLGRLRSEASGPEAASYATLARTLFDVEHRPAEGSQL